MPNLHWIWKEKIMSHHQDVPYKVLNHKYWFTKESWEKTEKANTGNKIIKWDNLEALKALLPEYEWKVDCIYIDPPYNTGNENWVYNDNVNHPKIKKWLWDVVWKDSEDLSRHDKWLCMMYPRLKLLHKLLSNDWVIFISIDDNELAHLRLLMDEIFWYNNFIANFSWVRKKKWSFLSKKVRKMLENVVCFEKKNNNIEYFWEKAYSDKYQPIVKRTNSEKILDFKGWIIETKLADWYYEAWFKWKQWTGIFFLNKIEVKKGLIVNELKCKWNFVWTQDFLNNEIKQGSKVSLSTKFWFNVLRHNQWEKIKTPSTLINDESWVGTNEDATSNLKEMFELELGELFNYSKPYSLVKYLIKMVTAKKKNSFVLDSFAGSGTTGHAVMKLNEEDQWNRKFILVELEDYAEEITAERNKRVIQGYGEEKGIWVGFDFYELGETLFVDGEQKILNSSAGVKELRKYIYYTETGDLIDEENLEKNIWKEWNKYYLGNKFDTWYYFYYEEHSITHLDEKFLWTIWEKAGNYLMYADVCDISQETLRKNNIIFKKIPRDITKI